MFLLLGSSLLQGTFLAFLLLPAGWARREHQGTLSKHPPGIWLASTIACESLLRLLVLCQGMLKIWALTSRLQAPQGLPGEGLSLTLFSSSLHCSTMSELYQHEQGDEEGGYWRFGNYFTNAGEVVTFCYQWGGDILHHLDAIHQKLSITLLKSVGLRKRRHFHHQFLRCISPWDHDVAEQVL